MLKITDNKRLIYFILCLSALVTVFLTCHFSPFFPSNTDMDINMFKLISKGMREGRVPYKDMFDHKGLWLYFTYIIGDWVSFSGIDGMFFISALCGMIMTVYSYKTISLILDDKGWRSIAITIVGTIFVYGSIFYGTGGNVEDLVLPMFSISIYSLVRLAHTDFSLGNGFGVLTGIFVGYIFWSKFFVLAFYVGYFLVLLFVLAKRKRLKQFFKFIAFVFAGFIISTVPIVIYCLETNSLSDMINIYIYNNVFVYPAFASTYEIEVSKITVVLVHVLTEVCNSALPLLSGIVLGYVTLAKSVDFGLSNRCASKYLFCVYVVSQLFIIMFGLGYDYYYIPLLIWVYVALAFFAKIVLLKSKHNILPICIICFAFVSLVVGFVNSKYSSALKTNKTLSEISEIVNQTENADVLIVGFGDSGILMSLDNFPNRYYLMPIGMWSDEIKQEYKNYVVVDKVPYILAYCNIDGTLYQKTMPWNDLSSGLSDDNFNFLDSYSECYSGYIYFGSSSRNSDNDIGTLLLKLYKQNDLIVKSEFDNT